MFIAIKMTLVAALLFALLYVSVSQAQLTAKPYPSVRRDDQTFTHSSLVHGQVDIVDSYTWLEVDKSQSSEVQQFAQDQTAYLKQYTDDCKELDTIRTRLQAAYNDPRYTAPRTEGPYDSPTYYYAYNAGLDDQSTWYQATRQDLLDAERDNYQSPAGQKWFNCNLLSSNGSVAVQNFIFSPSGEYAAYIIPSDSNGYDVYFRLTSSKFIEPVDDPAEAAKGGPDRLSDVLYNVSAADVQWSRDSRGVFYVRNPTLEEASMYSSIAVDLLYHRMGTSQDADTVIISKEQNLSMVPFAPVDGRWLLVNNYHGGADSMRVFLAPLFDQDISSNMKWLSVETSYDNIIAFVENYGNVFYFYSNKDAPNFKLVRTVVDPGTAQTTTLLTDLQGQSVYEDVIAEDPDSLMQDIYVIDVDKVISWYVKDGRNVIYQFELQSGKQVQRLLPDFIGSVGYIRARTYDHEAFLQTTTFTDVTVYRLTWNDEGCVPDAQPDVHVHRSRTASSITATSFTTEQIFVNSTDGAVVPAYLVYRSDTKIDGSAPGLVFFYGAFGYTQLPYYDERFVSWIDWQHGVLIWISARGGADKGGSWYDDGKLLNKQHTFDDVIAVTEYAVENDAVARGKIIVFAEQMGGLGALVVANQASEGLVGAVLADDSLSDMIRFPNITGGDFWLLELGDPSNSTFFDVLYGYSPYHNVNSTKVYPMILMTAGSDDPHVASAHPFKMAAHLQHTVPNNPAPFLLQVATDYGNGPTDNFVTGVELDVVKLCLSTQALGLP